MLTEALGYARSINEIDYIAIHFSQYLQTEHKRDILDAIVRRQDNDRSIINKITRELL